MCEGIYILHLFLRFKDGREFCQNKSLTNINEFTVYHYHMGDPLSTSEGHITQLQVGFGGVRRCRCGELIAGLTLACAIAGIPRFFTNSPLKISTLRTNPAQFSL